MQRRTKTVDNDESDYLCERDDIEEKFQQLCQETSKEWVQTVTGNDKRNIRRQGLNHTEHRTKMQAVVKLLRLGNLSRQSKEHSQEKVDGSSYAKKMSQNELIAKEKVQFFVNHYFRRTQIRVTEIDDKAKHVTASADNLSNLVNTYGDVQPYVNVSFWFNPILGLQLSKPLRSTLDQHQLIMTISEQHRSIRFIQQRILQNFDISALKLAQLQSEKERVSYIVDRFNKTVDILLKDWQTRLLIKQKKLKFQDDQAYEEKKRVEKDSEDVFKWLQLKTKYEVLKTKLRQMIMENINEYENQLKIIKILKTKDISKLKDKDRISLLGIDQVSTAEIIRSSSSRQFSHSKRRDLIKSIQKNPPQQQPKIVDQFQDLKIQWNMELEKKFQKERQRAKKEYFKMIPTANFNQMACIPVVPDLTPDSPKHMQRDAKLAQYQNGEWLTAQELKFLANTSQLLNQCVDQNFIKNAVKVIQPSDIDQLEQNLAEQIIASHQNIIEKIKSARVSFLQAKTQKTRLEIERRQSEVDYHRDILIRRKSQAKVQKRLQVICDKMKSKISIKDSVAQNIYAQMFVKAVLRKIKEIRERRQYFKQNEPIDMYQEKDVQVTLKKERINELALCKQDKGSDKRRKFHPASKLKFFGRKANSIESANTLQAEILKRRNTFIDKKVEEFKLNILDRKINNKETFVKFYSNGPNKGVRTEPFFDEADPYTFKNVTKSELDAIIRIQKFFKKYLCLKKLKNFKEIYYSKKYKSYFQRIQSRVNRNKMYDVVQAASIQLKTNSSTDDFRTVRKKTESDAQVDTSERRKFGSNHKVVGRSYFSPSNNINTRASSRAQEKPSNLLTPTNPFKETTRETNFTGSDVPKLPSTDTLKKLKPKDSRLLVKHLRLLRYAKINIMMGVIKAGFVYTPDDANMKDEDGNTALYYASKNNNLKFVEYLLGLGADPNILCSDNTPFHEAFHSGNIDMIFMMLNQGGDLNKLNHDGQTPLMFANEKILGFLGMKQGVCSVADPDKQITFDNHTLLKRTYRTLDTEEILSIESF